MPPPRTAFAAGIVVLGTVSPTMIKTTLDLYGHKFSNRDGVSVTLRASGLGRMSEEVDAQQHDPTPVHEEEGALYESGVSSVPLKRESCPDG